ncbi:MAG TPA: carboxyltransferase domain-containing protein [Gaiellaceae bacterium]
MPAVGQYLRVARTYDPAACSRILTIAAALRRLAPDGVREICAAPGSVYVEWDDERLPSASAARWIDAAIEEPGADDEPARTVEVPVRYGGPDTEEAASMLGLDARELASIHAGGEYRVFSTATAGQPIMGGADARLELPRRPVPRASVPERAVGIQGRFSTVYAAGPGGWNLIGTALVNVFDPHRDDPFTFHHGDVVRFHASDAPDPPAPARRELLPREPARPALRVEAAGALDLVLDAGRLNQAHHGLAQTGPLDPPAARLANALCGNAPGTPCIESTLTGPTLVALRDLVVGAAGRGLALEVDGERVACESIFVTSGATLRLRPTGEGVRGYLAIAGGIEAEPFLGSVSVDRYGLIGRPLEPGDILGVAVGEPREVRLRATIDGAQPPHVIRVRRGPQWSREAEAALAHAAFTVTTGDRMGLRLAGPPVPGGELLSESPPPGAVQVPPSGDPIILLADRMRSAGYDKPAVVHPDDLPAIAQLRAGDRIGFAFVGDHPVPWERDLT